jgi:hypothetical protein|tara:strand:+ start:92 stop:361 length:270 start_codon:yes stop_codon:yes gene_type:complete
MNKKVEKISEEHLKDLQGKVNTINQAQLQLGGIESQKHALLHNIAGMQAELSEFQKTLEEEYGKVSINIQDGSITEIPQENTDETNTED